MSAVAQTLGGMHEMRTRSGIALAMAGAMVLSASAAALAQDDETEIAYLSASSANTWLGASKAVMDEIAAENGIKLTEFDAQFDAALQTTQLQDVIADGPRSSRICRRPARPA